MWKTPQRARAYVSVSVWVWLHLKCVKAPVSVSVTEVPLFGESVKFISICSEISFFFFSSFFQYHLAVLFDTSHLSGESETLQFLVHTRRYVFATSFVMWNTTLGLYNLPPSPAGWLNADDMSQWYLNGSFCSPVIVIITHFMCGAHFQNHPWTLFCHNKEA